MLQRVRLTDHCKNGILKPLMKTVFDSCLPCANRESSQAAAAATVTPDFTLHISYTLSNPSKTLVLAWSLSDGSLHSCRILRDHTTAKASLLECSVHKTLRIGSESDASLHG